MWLFGTRGHSLVEQNTCGIRWIIELGLLALIFVLMEGLQGLENLKYL